MRINYNISAMISNAALQRTDNALSDSIERLSSGLKINHAKDNASGIAMAKRMNAQIRSLSVANQNSNDGISVIEIAEGALNEIEEMVQRMEELAVKASNGVVDDNDRAMIDDEIQQLKTEIERVAETTMYNGEILLNGDFDVKGYTSDADLKVATYSDDVRNGDYSITKLITAFDAEGNLDPANCDIELTSYDGTVMGVTATYRGDAIYLQGANGFEMEFQVKNQHVYNITSAADAIEVDITGLGAMGVQIGTNEGQELDVRISEISLRALGLNGRDCRTEENAREFLSELPNTLKYINESRSRLGAYQNRLEHTVSTLDISENNMTAAYSRIMDVDMAEEMTEYSKYQVLVQSGTSMLAQANERPSSVLQLLQ